MASMGPLQGAAQNSVVGQYIKHYGKAIHHYKKTAEVVAGICKEALDDQVPKNWVTHRAKDPKSLENKLLERQRLQGHSYADMDEIEKDVVDLAGVRIILYFAADWTKVKSILDDKFHVKKMKTFPEVEDTMMDEDFFVSGGQQGYTAHHFRVSLRQDDMQKHHLDATDGIVEIQVTSLPQHIWAEIEHDLVYKPGSDVTDEHHIILAGLKAAANFFDSYLNRLLRIEMARIANLNKPFETRYELGTFVSNWIAGKTSRKNDGMKSVKALKKFLEAVQMNNRRSLRAALETIDFQEGPGSEYTTVVGMYSPIQLNDFIYIIDRTIWKQKLGRRAEDDTHPVDHNVQRLRIIISTIIWLDLLFVPSWSWNLKFLSPADKMTPQKGLAWLAMMVRQRQLLQGSMPFERADIATLNELWAWLEKHGERPVQLAFEMSKLGMLRDLPRELGVMTQAIEPLTEGLRAPLVVSRIEGGADVGMVRSRLQDAH